MSNNSKKIKLIEILTLMKKNSISNEEAFEKITNIISPKINFCPKCKEYGYEENIQKTSCKYPDGLAIDTLDITYCENCGTVIDVTW